MPAGLPIFPGLVRYDEVAVGEIAHALRFTAPKTRASYVWRPATRPRQSDDSGASTARAASAEGRRGYFGLSPASQVILKALKAMA